MTTPPDDPRADEDAALIAALLSLTESGVHADIMEMLVGGDHRGTIPPGVMRRAVRAALTAARSHGGM